MRRITSPIVGAVAGALLLLPGLAACTDNQPGDTNNGPGYTNNITDLQVKVPALLSDPCRGSGAATLYPSCGRYVTEIANVVSALSVVLPNENAATTALRDAVNKYQQLGCDTITGTPTAAQQTACPNALTTIGVQLDHLEKALTSTTSTTSR